MKNHSRKISPLNSGLLVLAIAAVGVGVATAASGNIWQSPSGLDVGTPAAGTHPMTGAEVKVDRFDNVEKAAGEIAGLVDESTEKTYFTIQVTHAELADRCDARVGAGQLRPTRTKFLILDVKASLASSVSEKVGGKTGDLYMPLVAEAFSITTGSGEVRKNLTSETAWGCLDDSALLPAVVNPGQSVRGKVVLDVADVSGKVAYDPEGNGGWSWPYGG
ncbi:hypothetical protein CGQ24_11335 [Arthrobacter sp. 7749]|nr:hypothetical protein CGQ24_11335 [Arthrobacter sp. 7749]